MDSKTFLQRVLSGDGHYCLFASKLTEEKRTQKFYTSLEDLIHTATNLDQSGFDTYFALGTFKEEGSRKTLNVKELKSFFFDIDCGPSKEYIDQTEGLKALRSFTKAVGLPKPLIISSGRGIHVYWALSKAVSYEKWLPVAEQLKRYCGLHKFLPDPAVTADGARVLRVPYTHNHKGDPPLPVLPMGVEVPELVDFEEFSEILGGESIPVPQKFTPAPSSAMMDALMGNMETKFRDILVKTKEGNGCAQLAAIIGKQEECSEPMWRAGLSIAKFCVDSDKAIMNISKRHPEFSEQETMEKVNLIKGPYLCSTFDEYNPNVCTECKHWGKIKSPIVLGKAIKEAQEGDNVVEAPSADRPNNPIQVYTIPDYPRPYFRGAQGGIYIRSSSADGEIEEKMVYHNDLYVVKRIRDAEMGEAIVMRLHLPKDGVREFTVPLTAATSKEEFRKHMSMQGVAVSRMDELMQYTTTWVNELQASATADEAHRQFGWTSEEMKSFILGNMEIFGDRIAFNPPSTNTAGLFHAFEPKGTLEGWKEVMGFFNEEGQEAYQYVVGASFGSILMELMPVACASLHIHSKDTGYGKTTALYAALTPWGNPKELLMEKEDTLNTKMNRGEIYHSLPFFLDEITNLSPKDLSNLAYQYVSGRQRRRLTGSANVERYNGLSWSFNSVSTGNVSIIERIGMYKNAPKAEAQRILEYKVDKMFKSPSDKERTDQFSKEIFNHWGHAGIPFVQCVINNLEEIKGILEHVQKRIDKDAGLAAENRFWSAGVACSLTALILCNKIGLLPYDSKPVYKWILEVLKKNKNASNDMNESVEQLLNDYINENWNNILQIKSTDDLRKAQNNGLNQLIVPDALPRGALVARYETDTKRAFLVPKFLRTWCGAQQINYASFLQDLTDKLGAKRTKMRLGKGTHMQLPSTDVISVDCSSVDVDAED